MKTAAIICEYDPFHLGHKKQIQIIRKAFGDDTVIISLMSGSTVQRGRFSIYPKYVRAEAGVKNGSDLVLELPYPYCSAGAEGFARGAVQILNGLTNIDYLVFGSECGDIDALKESADIINSKEYVDALKSCENDASHIKNCEKVFYNLGGKIFPSSPNDILAVEYIAALIKTESKIIPYTYKREEGYSATKAREALINEQDLKNHLSAEAISVFEDIPLTDTKPYESIALNKIRQSDSSELSTYYGMNGGVSGLIKRNAEEITALDGLITACTSRSYTASRIRRAILSAVLEIRESDVKSVPIFTNLLASNQRGRQYLSSVRKTSDIKVITKPADALKLDEKIKKQFEKSLRADRLMALLRNEAPSSVLKKNPITL